MQRHLAFYSPLKKHLATKIGSFPLIKNGSKNARVLFITSHCWRNIVYFPFGFWWNQVLLRIKKGDISMNAGSVGKKK